MSPKTIGVIAHTGKPGVAELVTAVAEEFARFGITVRVEKATAALVGQSSEMTVPQLAKETDLLVVLGGDGTILNVADQLGEDMKPIFGINVGSLGFLTCSNSAAYVEAVESVAKGRITFSERSLLEVKMMIKGKQTASVLGLNDAVLSRGEISRLIRLRTRVNGEALTEFNADGIIIATPTGSTAYSLSAGGPIMAPESGVFVITPICPHVLTNRSIIVRDDSLIEVEVTESDYPVFLTVDGRDPVRVEMGTVVAIQRARKTLPLAVMPDVSFFRVVRQKLKWSGSNI
ncbi:MAG: kinase [Verrucomicrobiota bacterium]|jgi:NAD+ kinase